jgi:uncharacterized protein YdhG (YjbR/CyaY superfamily)
MNNLLEQLKGGDLRSIGNSNQIVDLVLKNPRKFSEVFNGISHSDPVIRMRSADVAEKVSRKNPALLQPFKLQLLNEISNIPQQEVRWHVAQMFSYLTLSSEEKHEVANILFQWIKNEKSNIVKVMSLQTLADFAKQETAIKSKVLILCKKFLHDGSPSLKRRSAKILTKRFPMI